MKALSILLVEDSPSDVRLIREALKETPLKVDIMVKRDGVEAMEHLHQVEQGLQFRPGLVLLDLNLPKKNGREVLAEIKSSPSLKQIPVLVMTSSRADEDVVEAYTLNANCYITKPIDLNEYLSVVRAIEDFWFITATLPDAVHGPQTSFAPLSLAQSPSASAASTRLESQAVTACALPAHGCIPTA